MKEGQNPPETRPPQASLKDASDKARSFFSELLREKAKKEQEPPLQPGEVFTPGEEIKKIKDLPKESRPAKLKEIKEKLAYQKKGLGKIQEELIKTIRANPDTTYAQLFDQAKKAGVQYGLDWHREERIRSTIRGYVEKHQAVEKTRKGHPDDADLFKKVFGRLPKDTVQVKKGPMTLHFTVRDPADYALIHSGAFLAQREPTSEEIAEAEKTGGYFIESSLIPELAGTITVERPTFIPNYAAKHEEQHAIQSFLKKEGEKWKSDDLLVEAYVSIVQGKVADLENNLRRYFLQSRRAEAEELAKDEILSYFKDKTPGEEIIKSLIQKKATGGLYDFFPRIEIDRQNNLLGELREEHAPLIKKVFQEVFDRKKYAQSIKDAVVVFSALRKKGYSLEQTIALLQSEPLFKWKKTYKRLTGESIENKK